MRYCRIVAALESEKLVVAASPAGRVRLGSACRLGLGLLVLVLGLTAFRAGEAHAHGTDTGAGVQGTSSPLSPP